MPPKLPSALERHLRRINAPQDYFGETRSSLPLWPERILCFTRTSQAEMDQQALERHHHHRHVLVLPLEGKGEVYVDDRQFKLASPHALMIFPFQFHHGFRLRETKALWQIITFELRNGATLETLRLHPLRKFKAADLDVLSHLTAAWVNSKADELAHWLGLFLVRLLASPQAARVRPSHDNFSPLLTRINQACMPHLDQSFGLKELSARLSMSESHLRSCFRKETGISLGKHLRRLRLQKSVGLLVQSDLSITQIAERCGFESVFAFSRSFRQFTNITARDYRLRFRKHR